MIGEYLPAKAESEKFDNNHNNNNNNKYARK
jgi:hypothetical protein